MGFRVLGFGLWSGLRVLGFGLGFRALGFGFKFRVFGFGLGFRVRVRVRLRVCGLGFCDLT